VNILFYSPFDQRSRDSESLMIAFHKQGHRVISLSQAEGKLIHPYLESQGILTFSHQIKASSEINYFIKHIIHLIRFCYKYNVEIIYSHLESANFVAVIAQYFIKANVYINRHHIDEAALQRFDQSIIYKLTYKLARKIIAVSERAVDYMIKVEKIRPTKIIKINLAYDFTLYTKPNPTVVDEIKEKVSADLVLLTACRYTKYKRADLSIRVLRKLIDHGINAKLILLGKGEEELNLKNLINESGLADRVVMAGYVNNITDYLAASDFLLHPSVLESSCVVVKEAAITLVPVIVCGEIGDFNDYIAHGENGIVVNKDNFVDEAVACLLEWHQLKEKLARMAKNLRTKVEENFSVKEIIFHYSQLNSRTNKVLKPV
jgi:glycosyltransferase involved in cell wall biosynthesis